MSSSVVSTVKHLWRKYPLVANSVIYGSLYVGAEFSQQVVTRKFMTNTPENIDKMQLGRYAVMGTLIYAPSLFVWYRWLDRRFPGTTKKIIFKKLMLDQFLFTPPLLAAFFTGMSLMENADDKLAELKQKFMPTFLRSCYFWLPAQTLNFLWVPAQFRVIYVGSCAVIWVNILCWIKRQAMTIDSADAL